jgi:hypothetical protein
MTPRRAGPASIRRQGGRKPGTSRVGARAPRAPEGAAIGTRSARLVTPVPGQRAVRRSDAPGPNGRTSTADGRWIGCVWRYWPSGCSTSGSRSRLRRRRERALRCVRSARTQASATGASQAANSGAPTQTATTSGTTAAGAWARIAPAQRAMLKSAVTMAPASTTRGCVRVLNRPVSGRRSSSSSVARMGSRLPAQDGSNRSIDEEHPTLERTAARITDRRDALEEVGRPWCLTALARPSGAPHHPARESPNNALAFTWRGWHPAPSKPALIRFG